jgi:hypothetical protein
MDDIQNPPPPYSLNFDPSPHYNTSIEVNMPSIIESECPSILQESGDTADPVNPVVSRFPWISPGHVGHRDLRAVYAQEHPQYYRLPQELEGGDVGVEFDSEDQSVFEEGAQLWEGERSDGGIPLPNAYIENNEDAHGFEIVRRNGLEPRGLLDKTVEIKEGQSDIMRVASRPTSVRQTPLLSLCARILRKLPFHQKKRRWSLRIKHFLGINPGFCPGALAIRRAEHEPVFSFGTDHHKCPYCGLSVRVMYPESYKDDWPTYQSLSRGFILQSHLPAGTRDQTERRSCLICWEYEGVWAGAMDEEEWGKHVRRHFKEDGYWVCETSTGRNRMVDKRKCMAKKCKAVHS